MLPDTLALPHFGAIIPCEQKKGKYGRSDFVPKPVADKLLQMPVVDLQAAREPVRQAKALRSQRIYPTQYIATGVWKAHRSTEEGACIDKGYLVRKGDQWTLHTGNDAKALKREWGLSWPERLLRKVTGALSPGQELACHKIRGTYYRPDDRTDWKIFIEPNNPPSKAELVDECDKRIATGKLTANEDRYQFTVTRSSGLWPLRQALRDWLAPEPKYTLLDGD